MSHDDMNRTDRRKFLQAGRCATASAASLTPGLAGAGAGCQVARAARPGSSARPGVEVTMLEQGAVRSDDRVLRHRLRQRHPPLRHRQGLWHRAQFQEVVRTRSPKVRKEIFIVTKDMPSTAQRDAPRWSTSGSRLWGPTTSTSSSSTASAITHELDESIDLIKSQEFKETADAIRKSGKARFIGFSTHNKDRAPIIQAAAEAGIVDAIMLQYRPGSTRTPRSTRPSTSAGRRGSA